MEAYQAALGIGGSKGILRAEKNSNPAGTQRALWQFRFVGKVCPRKVPHEKANGRFVCGR